MRTKAALLFCFFVAVLLSQPPDKASDFYNHGRYEESLKLLAPAKPLDAKTNDLIGKNYFMLGDFKKAVPFFEKSVELGPKKSDYHLWLGRAYGRQAQNSSFLSAIRLAAKARQSFERSVELDPSNKDALFDLFEYYLFAPSFLGGGHDKAENIAAWIMKLDRANGYSAKAFLAEQRGELKLAEEYFRKATALALHDMVFQVLLAKFLARRGRFGDSEEAFSDAEKISRGNPDLLFERAETYIYTKHNLGIARELLQHYLRSELTPSNPPRYDAEKLLKKLLNKLNK